jgi:hypothetical protein
MAIDTTSSSPKLLCGMPASDNKFLSILSVVACHSEISCLFLSLQLMQFMMLINHLDRACVLLPSKSTSTAASLSSVFFCDGKYLQPDSIASLAVCCALWGEECAWRKKTIEAKYQSGTIFSIRHAK